MQTFRRRMMTLTGSGAGAALEAAAIAAAAANSAPLWYIPDAFQGVYQDTPPVTAITAAGQSIGTLYDQRFGKGVGGGTNATQGTAGSKPTVSALSTGHYSALFDGTDDLLSCGSRTSGSAGTLIAAFIGPAAGTAAVLSNGGSAAGVAGASLRLSAGLNIMLGTSNGTTQIAITMGVATAGTAYVASGDWDGTVGKRGWVNGVSGGTDPDVTVDPTAAAVFAIGARQVSSPVQFFGGKIALACQCSTKMSDADRRAIEAFGAYLVGSSFT